ncbi:hypothetical protein FSZ31_00290 [Sphingorhabdus soli]|uniref:DUF4345 domain-containing protein n=1 Tax=Flavisphingopyxis soli TaxID=2601267 RepID=A0A5C6UJW3_9SPHN|nr:hypothetical protein [Sphingorhabdus soli]TXC73242.1 hypothetical protein FSZ31_00290 [Sphingorhabdus soli]
MGERNFMKRLLRGAVVLWAVYFLVLGVRGLIDPGVYADNLGVSLDGVFGASTIRGDLSAFFIVASVFALLGALPFRDGRRRRHDWLLVPASLFAVALAGRGIALPGGGASDPGISMAMIAEAVSVVLLLVTWRVLGRTRR